jgi:alkylation response protein AidB-like acyl-CoA dehydrogenase
MQRDLFHSDHEAYRDTVKEFLAREVIPFDAEWEANRWIDRNVYTKAANAGVYGLQISERFGGPGEADFRYRMVACEEIARAHALSFGMTVMLQDDLVLPYFVDLASEEQQQRWLPGIATGEYIGALAMTEPEAGSDLRGMRTTAVRSGDSWILNGQKTFITSGLMADFVIVAARTDEGKAGVSLFVVEEGTTGFERGRKLEKIGLAAQDTAELFFHDAEVPAENLLGEPGSGLAHLMSHLPRERLGVTATAIATARATFDLTVEYCQQRKAFGAALTAKQHVRFELAEMATELDVAQAYVDRSIVAYNAGDLTATDAAKAKWYLTELQKSVLDRCLQLHGGYGYMSEYPVARAFIDSRAQTIYGGTTEIMKEIIGREFAQ